MPEVVVRASPIGGRGVFTVDPLRAGEVVREFELEREVTPESPLRADRGERPEQCPRIDGRFYLVGSPDRYFNHCCDPNVYLRFGADRIDVVARREIAAGSELTLDYLINNPGGESWPCHCGAARCRRETGQGFFALPEEIQREYLPLLAPWFLGRYARELADLGAAVGRIYVARHGQSTWNAEHRWTGHADPPLSETGRAQARAACEALRVHRFDAVGSSTLARATETAAIIASGLGLPRLEAMGAFDERHAGPISGMTSAEIEARWPGFVDRWRAGIPVEIPGGEPWQAFVDRVMEGLERLQAAPGRILLVSHMGVQRAIEEGLGRPLGRYGNLEGLWVTGGRLRADRSRRP